MARDPVQLNMLFEQSKQAILAGTHPVTLEESKQFAAYLLQIQFGDHKHDKHKPGFTELVCINHQKVDAVKRLIEL